MLSFIKKHSRVLVALLLVGMLAGSVAVFTATHAAAPTGTWNIGDKTSGSSGTIIFNNRSVQIGGAVRDFLPSPNNCVTVTFEVFAGSGELSSASRSVCSGSRGFGFTLPANVRGGAGFVNVNLLPFNVGATVFR